MPAQKRQPRLKESCDSCSTAKVRCTKDKPHCSRCQQKGLPCSYSYSRRAGRKTTASAVTKVDRRPRSPSSSAASSPMLSSSSDEDLQHSPADSDSSDVFDNVWSTGGPPYSNPFPWNLQNSLLNQYTPFPAMDPTGPTTIPSAFDTMDVDMMPSVPAPPASMMARNFSNTTDMSELTLSSDISSTSSSSSSSLMHEALHDELANLTTFAESMERKFDAVVRARLQYRDVYSDFGVPVDEIESNTISPTHHHILGDGMGSVMSAEERILGAGGVAAGKGGVPSPDCNELAFYYCLAELKRRLKWVREDVGNLMLVGQGDGSGGGIVV